METKTCMCVPGGPTDIEVKRVVIYKEPVTVICSHGVDWHLRMVPFSHNWSILPKVIQVLAPQWVRTDEPDPTP